MPSLHRRLLPAVLLAATVIGLGGCTTYVDHRVYSVTQMSQIKTQLLLAPEEIDRVATTLDTLASQSNQSQHGHYFLNAVTAAVQRANLIRGMNMDMESREAAFMADWAAYLATVQDPAQRETSEQARDAAKLRFDELERSITGARARFEPWIQDVLDARKLLQRSPDADPTHTLTELAQRVSDGAGPLKAAVGDLITELDRSMQTVSKSSPPPVGEYGG